MQAPTNYLLKKWLCENTIIGCKVHYYQTGIDTSNTDWELIPSDGKTKRVLRSTVQYLIEYNPDWVRLFTVKESVRKEVDEWKKYEIKERRDLAEYNRLKAKFA